MSLCSGPMPKANRSTPFWLTADYRPVNGMTIPIAAYGFAGFNMSSGFSQLPLAKGSHNIMRFITDGGV
ncbi:hypothetical protein PHMEG_00010362 [Phytophthora megakarya]|uniref:Uncharacterized protein n=1 Tax=Phytophthora megakarya TaxID=4795 RepID=A0A225WFX5_9STRA|nr:hypothetical protein PHMEG_00010362 [Phytophthora megakarya]